MRPSTRRSTALAIALCVGSTSRALAQPATPGGEDSPAARFFRDGRDGMKRGDYVGACAKFEESERLAPAPGTLLNLAACREKLGKLNGALAALAEARASLPAGDSRIAYIRDQETAMAPRVPSLTIRVSPTVVEGARVTLDGEEIGSAALAGPVRLDPGSHIVTLSAPGRAETRRPISLAEGATETITLTLGAPNASRYPDPSPGASNTGPRDVDGSSAAPSPGSANRTGGYVALGVGGVGLVVGAIGGIIVLNKKSTMDSNCDERFACNPEGMDAASSGKTFSTISTVGFVVGMLGAGVGAYLLLTDEGSGGSSAALGVVPTTRGGVVSARGRF